MKPRELAPGVHWVGAIDWDRRLFDALIPLPDGTSYNAYLVQGKQKTALIDTADPTLQHVLEENLKDSGVQSIDYVIANHAEQDHSGTLPRVLAKYPQAKLVCTPRCQEFLTGLLNIAPERFQAVEDDDSIDLGGKTLDFIHFPWVHWPETMLTYLKEDGILFSCDLFGAHLATADLYVGDRRQYYLSAKRYFAEIMMPFAANIQKSWPKLDGLKINKIAPSHGPLHDDPDFIREAYREWVFGQPQNTVVLPYISMHGSTKLMVEHFVGALMEHGVGVEQFDLADTDVGQLAMSLVDAPTVVLGTPTVLAGAHPNVAHAAFLANALRPRLKFAAIIGSYGWGGKTVEQLSGMIPNLKVEVLGTVLAKGLPQAADYKALDDLAETIAKKHKEAGFV